VKCGTVSTGSGEALMQAPGSLNIVISVTLVRDLHFFTSVFILYLCKKNAYKEMEVWDLFVLLYRITCVLFVASQREKSIGSYCTRLPTRTAKLPGFPGSLDSKCGRKCWWET